MSMDIDNLRRWIGKTEPVQDSITAAPVRGLGATLDHPPKPVKSGELLPPLWRWLYFLPQYRQSELGPDDHAKRGGFLPPAPLS